MVSSRVSCCFTSSEPLQWRLHAIIVCCFLISFSPEGICQLLRIQACALVTNQWRLKLPSGGRNVVRGGWVGNVRGRAAAGDLLLINEPLDALGACSCETAALRSAKSQERVARWPRGRCSRSRFDRSWTDNCQRLKSTKKMALFFHSLLALEHNTKRRHSRVLLLRQTGALKILSLGSSFSKYACLASLTGAVGSLQLYRTTNVQKNRCI